MAIDASIIENLAVNPLKKVSSSVTLAVYEQIVHVANSTGGAGYTITLPSLALAIGKTYSIFQASGTDDLTITPAGSDAIEASLTPTAVGDYVVLYSNGLKWLVLTSVIGGTRN